MPDTDNKDNNDEKPEETVSERFSTPILDSLRERRRNFVMHYCRIFDVPLAAKLAGYCNVVSAARKTKETELIGDPMVVAAIDEYLKQRLDQIGHGKSAMCAQMLSQCLANVYDICDRVPYKNGHGNVVEGKWMFIPKELVDIEPQFVAASSLMVRRADGSWGFDSSTQLKTRVLLSKLLMWDQGILDQGTPIIFNFGNIQAEAYKRPERKDSQADMSTFEKDDDIDDLAK